MDREKSWAGRFTAMVIIRSRATRDRKRKASSRGRQRYKVMQLRIAAQNKKNTYADQDTDNAGGDLVRVCGVLGGSDQQLGRSVETSGKNFGGSSSPAFRLEIQLKGSVRIGQTSWNQDIVRTAVGTVWLIVIQPCAICIQSIGSHVGQSQCQLHAEVNATERDDNAVLIFGHGLAGDGIGPDVNIFGQN